jgi:hypothetical protein
MNFDPRLGRVKTNLKAFLGIAGLDLLTCQTNDQLDCTSAGRSKPSVRQQKAVSVPVSSGVVLFDERSGLCVNQRAMPILKIVPHPLNDGMELGICLRNSLDAVARTAMGKINNGRPDNLEGN